MAAPAVRPREVVDTSTGESLALVPSDAAHQFSMQQYLANVTSASSFAAQQSLAKAYDHACRELIGPDDIQVEGDREFKKKSAWRKLGRHFNIGTRVISKEFKEVPVPGDRFEVAAITLAEVVVEAVAPWGQSAQAIGACGFDEEVGRRTISLADMVATAETRATNRAISNLIAMGEVSADEIQRGQPREAASGNGSSGNRYPTTPAPARRTGSAGGRKVKAFNADEKIGFGKHKHLSWREAAAQQPDYVQWLIDSNAEKPDSDQYKRGPEWVDAVTALLGGGQKAKAGHAQNAGPGLDSGPLGDEPDFSVDDYDPESDLPF